LQRESWWNEFHFEISYTATWNGFVSSCFEHILCSACYFESDLLQFKWNKRYKRPSVQMK
jgi:hypothetical protein